MHDLVSLLGMAAAASAVLAFVVSLPADPPRWRRLATGWGFALAFACLTLADGLLLDMTHVVRQGEEGVEIRPYFVAIGIPLGVAQAWLSVRLATRRSPAEGSGEA